MLTPLYACPSFYAAFSKKRKLEDGKRRKYNNKIIIFIPRFFFSCALVSAELNEERI